MSRVPSLPGRAPREGAGWREGAAAALLPIFPARREATRSVRPRATAVSGTRARSDAASSLVTCLPLARPRTRQMLAAAASGDGPPLRRPPSLCLSWDRLAVRRRHSETPFSSLLFITLSRPARVPRAVRARSPSSSSSSRARDGGGGGGVRAVRRRVACCGLFGLCGVCCVLCAVCWCGCMLRAPVGTLMDGAPVSWSVMGCHGVSRSSS